MRITGGHGKGRRLSSPKGWEIRPSSDKLREALFSLIGQDLSGQQVLDLFAGTGCLGIEALSRGAASAVFIDRSRRACNLIKKNLSVCGYSALGTLFRKDLERGLPRSPVFRNKRFHLVFIDPPYGKELIPPLVGELVEKELLTSTSLVVAEASRDDVLPAEFGRLVIGTTKTYGKSRLHIYRRRGFPK